MKNQTNSEINFDIIDASGGYNYFLDSSIDQELQDICDNIENSTDLIEVDMYTGRLIVVLRDKGLIK